MDEIKLHMIRNSSTLIQPNLEEKDYSYGKQLVRARCSSLLTKIFQQTFCYYVWLTTVVVSGIPVYGWKTPLNQSTSVPDE